jgi:hypothetical protein
MLGEAFGKLDKLLCMDVGGALEVEVALKLWGNLG